MGTPKRRIFFWGLMIIIIALVPFAAGCGDSEEVITLRYASAMPEFVAPSQFAIHFMNYVEEKSGGRVKFKTYHAGLLGEIFEMLNLVSTGAIDMTLITHPIFKEQLPLHNFPEDITGGMDKAMDCINKLNFEIPETSSLLEKEYRAINIKGLNYCALGEDGILATTIFNSLADLEGKKLGADKEIKAYAQLGFNIVSVTQADMYEALARGVCDALPFAIEAVASNRWYEKAECYMYNSSYHGGFQITVNLDTWNKLPADIQEILMAAAADTEAFSVEWDKRKSAEYEQILKDAGLIVGRLPESDSSAFLKLSHQIDREDMLAIAKKVGKAEEAKIILKHFDELAGVY